MFLIVNKKQKIVLELKELIMLLLDYLKQLVVINGNINNICEVVENI